MAALPALAVVLLLGFSCAGVSATDSYDEPQHHHNTPQPYYQYKSPPPPYYYNSPPPYYYSSPPPYSYSSPPPPSYYYSSPPPPVKEPYYYTSPPPPYYHSPIVIIIGKVFCFKCYNVEHPDGYRSPSKKLLKGVIVKATCRSYDKEYVGYGETNEYGSYNIHVEGYHYEKYGAGSCKVELHAAPQGSVCNIPVEELSSHSTLVLKYKNYNEVVFRASILAYRPEHPYPECHKPVYHYTSPPPPVYYYKSPPPPTYYYSSPPPDPVYHYSSPPPPVYHYSSPPPPTYYYSSPPPPPAYK